MERAVLAVRERISRACERSGRDPADVRLVGVTKKVSAEAVRRAVEAGLNELGENYVQEMERKREAAPGARWHFLGRVQSNKARRILEAADVIQTLEPGRAVGRLARWADERGRPAACLVQVDLTERGDRVGVPEERVGRFLEELEGTPLEVGGLMTLAPLGDSPRPAFRRLRTLRDGLVERFPGVRELSMGMSTDLEEAVEEGATMVRVGTAIFGPRP